MEVGEKYVKEAKKLAKLMVENDYDLVWGGTNKGLMKVMADSVQKAGGRIIGITMEMLKDDRRLNANKMIIAKDLPERKALFLKRSSAIVLLVGGIGSLDEITEILEYKKHNIHNKPVVVLNTDSFYKGLKNQLIRMEKDGFLPKKINDLLFFADTPKEAIGFINKSL